MVDMVGRQASDSGEYLTSYAAAPQSEASTDLAGAWLPDAMRGWSAEIFVQNPSGDKTNIELQFLRRNGTLISSESHEICAGGTVRIEREFEDGGPGHDAGSVRIRSRSQDGRPGAGVLATMHVAQHGDSEDKEVHLSAAYRLTPIMNRTPDEGLADAAVGQGPGAGTVLAVPLSLKDLEETRMTVELALSNFASTPGWTDVAIFEFDTNALVNTRCRRLEAGTTQVIDYQTNSSISNGFHGSSLVSAVFWSHVDVDLGRSEAPQLGGMLFSRRGARRNEDIPGDELAATRLRALERMPASLNPPSASICLPKPGLLVEPTPGPTVAPPPDDASGEPSKAALTAMAWLPVLRNQGYDFVCEATLQVRNPSEEPVKAMLVTWSEPGFCSPQCAGPMEVRCSGLIGPGQEWHFSESDFSDLIASGVVYSLNASTLDELGILPESSEIAADLVCSRFVELAIENCEAETRFRAAFAHGKMMPGEEQPQLPLDKVRGPALEFEVDRECQDPNEFGASLDARYSALNGLDLTLDSGVGEDKAYRYTVMPIFQDVRDLESFIYIQNTGLECTSISLSFHHFGDCVNERICRVFWLSPGESYGYFGSDCAGHSASGYYEVRAAQALAVMGEHQRSHASSIAPHLQTFPAQTGPLAFDFNQDGLEDEADLAEIEAAFGAGPNDVRWDLRFDLEPDGTIDANDYSRARYAMCLWSLPDIEGTQPSGPMPQGQVHLPVLAWEGGRAEGPFGAEECATRVSVQNLGGRPANGRHAVMGCPWCGHDG